MSTTISLFKFDLGSNLFVLVSEYKNYVSIGFRTCLVYTTGHQEVKLYPTKQGINLIHRQYATLVNLKDKLSKGLQKRESLTESLSYDTNVIISSVPKQQGKVVITNKQKKKQKKQKKKTKTLSYGAGGGGAGGPGRRGGGGGAGGRRGGGARGD